MKQFVFSLQSWYDMQISLEKQHKLQIGMIQARINATKDQLAALNSGFDKTKCEFTGEVSFGMAVHRAHHFGSYFDSAKMSMAALNQHIAQLEEEKEEWMQKLVQVRREIKLLDNLRENQYSEYYSEVKKQQNKFIDDLISYKVSIT
jgi:flagellar FliJ protein